MLRNILVDFDRCCKENNIDYSLAYGTLLRSIMYKGFIPWDDDIDIFLTRTNYDKIVQACNSKKYIFWHIKDPRNIWMAKFGKIFDPSTLVIEKFSNNKEKKFGVWIDVFVMDALPNDNTKGQYLIKYHYKKARFASKLCRMLRVKCKHWQNFENKINISIFNLKNAIRLHDNIIYSVDFDKAKYLGMPVGFKYYKKDIIPKEWFSEFVEVEFEGYKFPAIKEYDKFLTQYYGDYMKLPPKNERVGHNIEAYKL